MADSIDREYPAEATIGDQWRRGEAGKVGTPSLPPRNYTNIFCNWPTSPIFAEGKSMVTTSMIG